MSLSAIWLEEQYNLQHIIIFALICLQYKGSLDSRKRPKFNSISLLLTGMIEIKVMYPLEPISYEVTYWLISLISMNLTPYLPLCIFALKWYFSHGLVNILNVKYSYP